MSESPRTLWKSIGPGILFAGAAVGVSHLVQSTRAGAGYGMALVVFVVAANIVKYPAFRFGPQYAAATGTSMLQGYRNQGRWALALYFLLTLGTMWTVQAAVTVVTAGLFLTVFGLETSPIEVSAGVLLLCGALLGVGRYTWLDRATKVAVTIFTVATLAATVIAIPSLDPSGPWWPDFGALQTTDILFIVALVGWMPTAVDISVWQSLWTLARAKESDIPPSPKGALLDFHVGYVGTALLALCFVALGAAVLQGEPLEPSASAFGAQLINLYADTLGAWSRPLIGAVAFLVMFSTTLTVLDGFPRALAVLSQRAFFDEVDGDGEGSRAAYWTALVVLAAGSVLVLRYALSSLEEMVDLATTLSFLTGPILAMLNHRAMVGPAVPEAARPAGWLLKASLAGIAVQGAFALYYLWIKLAAGGP